MEEVVITYTYPPNEQVIEAYKPIGLPEILDRIPMLIAPKE